MSKKKGWDDSEGSRKVGSNGVGPGSNVQGGGAVGVTLWKQELVGDRGMLKVLMAFHHQVAQRITGMTEKRGAGQEW